jgi:hypothetical protein
MYGFFIHAFQIVEKGYNSRQFFINGLALLTGLLISAPGTRFPRGGPGASSALWRPAGSPMTSLSRRSRVPSSPISRVANQPKEWQHTFSNLAKCVAIFLIFWQVTVRRACSLAFFNPRNRQ